MLVRDLIKRLEAFNPETRVLLSGDDQGEHFTDDVFLTLQKVSDNKVVEFKDSTAEDCVVIWLSLAGTTE